MNIYEPCTIHGSHVRQPHAINRIFFSLLKLTVFFFSFDALHSNECSPAAQNKRRTNREKNTFVFK